jgi:hypothetical protein
MIGLFGLELRPIYEEGKEDIGIIKHSYAYTSRSEEFLNFVAKKDIDTGLREIITHMNHDVSKF